MDIKFNNAPYYDHQHRNEQQQPPPRSDSVLVHSLILLPIYTGSVVARLRYIRHKMTVNAQEDCVCASQGEEKYLKEDLQKALIYTHGRQFCGGDCFNSYNLNG